MDMAILLSIKPEHCKLITCGKKLIDVRKTAPKLETPFKVYIYETQGKTQRISAIAELHPGRKKVIGEFICDRIYQYSTGNVEGINISDEDMISMSCLTKKELCEYEFSAPQKDFCIYRVGLYGWHISDLVIYDKPKELSEFNHCGANYHFDPSITRPPQSWCYVKHGGADSD